MLAKKYFSQVMKVTKMNIYAWFVAKFGLTAYQERSGFNAKTVKSGHIKNVSTLLAFISFASIVIQMTMIRFSYY